MENTLPRLINQQKQINVRYETNDVKPTKKYNRSLNKIINIKIQYITSKFIKINKKTQIGY